MKLSKIAILYVTKQKFRNRNEVQRKQNKKLIDRLKICEKSRNKDGLTLINTNLIFQIKIKKENKEERDGSVFLLFRRRIIAYRLRERET